MQLKRKEFVWAHSPMSQSMVVGRWWQQKPEAAGYLVSKVGRQRTKNAAAKPTSSFCSPGSQPWEWCHPEWVLPAWINLSKLIPTITGLSLRRFWVSSSWQQRLTITDITNNLYFYSALKYLNSLFPDIWLVILVNELSSNKGKREYFWGLWGVRESSTATDHSHRYVTLITLRSYSVPIRALTLVDQLSKLRVWLLLKFCIS